jgi:Family of unknown function (DUF6152)
MRNKIGAGVLSLLSLFVCVAPALAHHSFSAEYDGSKNIRLTGTLTKVDWVNPHVFLHLDVKDRSGKVANWAIEMGPTVALHRYGAKRNMFVEGQTVTIDAYPAKDGTRTLAGFRHIIFPDGTEFNYKNPDAPDPK